jgi:hypothetical protein
MWLLPLNPERNRHRSPSAALAAQIRHHPSPLAELDIGNVQAGQLLPPQGAAQQCSFRNYLGSGSLLVKRSGV